MGAARAWVLWVFTLRMCGKRKSMPECMPVPRPMEDSTPSPIHHTANSTMCSSSSNSDVCGPSTAVAPRYAAPSTAVGTRVVR